MGKSFGSSVQAAEVKWGSCGPISRLCKILLSRRVCIASLALLRGVPMMLVKGCGGGSNKNDRHGLSRGFPCQLVSPENARRIARGLRRSWLSVDSRGIFFSESRSYHGFRGDTDDGKRGGGGRAPASGRAHGLCLATVGRVHRGGLCAYGGCSFAITDHAGGDVKGRGCSPLLGCPGGLGWGWRNKS